MEPKKLNAIILIGAGIMLMAAPQHMAGVFAGAGDYVKAGIHLLPVVGLPMLIIGIYRLAKR